MWSTSKARQGWASRSGARSAPILVLAVPHDSANRYARAVDDHNGLLEAVRQLARRVDALEDAVKKIVGRPPDAPPPSQAEVKVGGLGIGTLITLSATVVVPIVVAILMTSGGGP